MLEDLRRPAGRSLVGPSAEVGSPRRCRPARRQSSLSRAGETPPARARLVLDDVVEINVNLRTGLGRGSEAQGAKRINGHTDPQEQPASHIREPDLSHGSEAGQHRVRGQGPYKATAQQADGLAFRSANAGSKGLPPHFAEKTPPVEVKMPVCASKRVD